MKIFLRILLTVVAFVFLLMPLMGCSSSNSIQVNKEDLEKHAYERIKYAGSLPRSVLGIASITYKTFPQEERVNYNGKKNTVLPLTVTVRGTSKQNVGFGNVKWSYYQTEVEFDVFCYVDKEKTVCEIEEGRSISGNKYIRKLKDEELASEPPTIDPKDTIFKKV